MALKQLVNWLSQQRVDIPDLRAIESGVIFDLKTLIQCFVGDTPYILRGFTIPVTGISGPATSLQMVVDSSVVWLPDDTNGSFLRVPSGTANEILSPANPNVVGSFSPGANFISIQFNRATDPSTNDLVSIWDVDSQTEFDETAPRGLVMNYQIVINGSTFGNNAPVAIVNVSGSNVTSIKNCKQGLFRLGRGGANPNINYSHTYSVNPENNLTATSNSSPDPFTGGDWELNSWKDFADAVMTEFKNLKNSAFWYGTNSVIPGLNVTDLYFDAIGSKITGAGAWIHSSATPGNLSWTSTLNLRSIFGYMSLSVPANNVTLNDGDVAYLALQRNIDFQPSNTFTFINGSTSVTATLAIAGIAAGDFIKYEADNMTAWTKVQSIIGTSITLASAYPGSSATGKALQTVGSYTMQTASPNNVPNNSSTYWIAKRDDNAFASLTIASAGSNGLERASDIATLITTTPHGLVVGQSFAVSGASDSSFNGKFDVGTVVNSTTITYLNPGANFGPGSAGSGTVSAVPRIYLRGGGAGELEQGESIQIDDQTTLNIQAFVGMEDETDVTPPYTIFPNGLSPYDFTSANNLTQAISAITGNVNNLYETLTNPSYDEPLIVINEAPSNTNHVQGPIISGSTLTLPNNSRNGNVAQEYTVGKGWLQVFLNGQMLNQNNAYDGGDSSIVGGWNEVGSPGSSSRTITIQQNLYTNDIVTFRIGVLGGPGSQGGGVSDVNGITGSVSIAGGSNISLNVVGPTITINATGGGGSAIPVNGPFTSNQTLTTAQWGLVLVNATSGSVTITLPSSGAGGLVYYIQKIDSSANPVIVSGGGPLINGLSTFTLPNQYDEMTFIGNGAANSNNWTLA